MRTQASIFLLALSCLCGCGDARRDRVAKVSGTVTYQGKPLDGAFVTFLPETPNVRSGMAETDAQGKFQLTTYDTGDGGPVGKCHVIVTKNEQDPNAVAAEPGERSPPRGRLLIPERYTRKGESGLEVDVVEGKDNVFAFELKD